MLSRAIVGALSFAFLVSCTADGQTVTDHSQPTVVIDGEPWSLIDFDDECYARIPSAVAYYAEFPIYRAELWPIPRRMLVNESSDCWIELEFLGVSDVSALFRVTPEFKVTDKRTLSWWGHKVRPYPNQPLFE
mgnify:CR=1 FL=1